MGLWYQANRYQRGIERAHPHFYHPFTGTYQNFHPASDRRWGRNGMRRTRWSNRLATVEATGTR
jgi:hypothetical protein